MEKLNIRSIVYGGYKIYGDIMSYYLHLYYVRWCKDIMRRQQIKNIKSGGEEAYIKKWKQLSKKVDPRYYRIFSQYIGSNQNIVPEDISHNIIEHILNPSKYRPYYEDKNMFSKIIPPQFMPVTLIRRINGKFVDAEYNPIFVNDNLRLKQYFGKYEKLIVKPTLNSSSGRNINLFVKNRNGEYHHIISEEILSLNYLNSKYQSDFIIQECLTQSKYISQFNPTSANTLRVLSYKSVKTNEIVIPSVIMRIGGKDSYVDNAHAGGVFIGINRDGTLCNFGADQYGNKYESFNGINFHNTNYQIPNFQSVLEFAKEIGKHVIHHRILQLDIVMTENGELKLIEYNISSLSVWLFQFTVSSAFEEYTDEIIDYCKYHKNEIQKVHVSVW